jgi:hypothetical protein
VRTTIRIILCLSVYLALASVAPSARAGCYPPPCAAPAASSGEPAAPVVAVGQSSADPVDSRSPALVVAFALLLIAGTLMTLCISRCQQGAMSAAALRRRPASSTKPRTHAEKSVA